MHPPQNRAYHGSLGALFMEKTHGPGSLNELHERPAMLDLIGDVTGQRILDLGAGDGFYAVELVGRGASSATALEGSAELAAHAGQRVARAGVAAQVQVVHHDIEQPFGFVESGSVDLAVCALAVHHVSNRTGLFAEVRRVLRSGGRFVVSTIHPFDDWRLAGGSYFGSEWIERPMGERGDVMRFQRAPMSIWVNELLEAGFLLQGMWEPQPRPELGEVNAEKYERLMAEPLFWLLDLRRS